MAKKISLEEFKEWMSTLSHTFEFVEEMDNTLIVKVTLYKEKWMCENCKLGFDEPEWMITPTSENPICPKCESLNVDLTKNITEHAQKRIAEDHW